MKFILTILSFFVFTFTEALPVSNPVVVLKAENPIDFTLTGLTLIASNLPTDFVPTEFIFYADTITGTPSNTTFSIGWTNPNYSDLLSPFHQPVKVTGCFANYGFGNTGPAAYGTAPIIPAATNIYINVTVPDTGATPNTQQPYIIGYYLY